MGTQARLLTPVSAVSLDELVPADHFYRLLDRALDLSFVRELVQHSYVAGKGRPSIDPVVFFRLQLVMFFEGIRSERQLLRLAADRLSVCWFLGYNLDEPLPDHSSLTRICARYGLEVFRRFFEEVVEQCRRAGLVWGKELYFDATKVNANASLDSLVPRFAVEARELLSAHLKALFAAESQSAEGQEPAEQVSPAPTQEVTGASLAADAASPAPPASPTPLPASPPTFICDDLAEANAARHDWIAAEGRPRREVRGYYQRTADVRVSTTDPDATPMRLKGGAPTWATKRTTSSTADGDASSWASW
jgi:transposase